MIIPASSRAGDRSLLEEIAALLPSFQRHLRAENRAERTVQSYTEATEQFVRHLKDQGRPSAVDELTKGDCEGFVADLLARWTPATAANRFRGLQQFFRWCEAEGEVARSPMTGMRVPRVPEQPPPVFTDPELKALLKACSGKAFEDVRDTAILRLLIDTGCRISELVGLQIENSSGDSDVDLDRGEVVFIGKGGRARQVGLGKRSIQALDRYERARRKHPATDERSYWIGSRGRLTVSGLAQMIERRASQAGVKGAHAHRFRHTFAHTWKASGGSEETLMHVGGWRSRQMLDRYGASAASQRAREAHRRLSPGDKI